MSVQQSSGRFALLLHDHPFRHWDLLLEDGPQAATWRLLRRPVINEPIAAEVLAPHRLLYLDYSGPVSGGRGTVRQQATGFWQQVGQRPVSAAGVLTLLEVQLTGWCDCSSARLIQTDDARCFWYFAAAAQHSG
jgi:hypothetical protein